MPSQPPDPYSRDFDFEQFSQQTPNAQQPGQEINQELDALSASVNQTISRLGELQADDGKLRVSAVPYAIEQLKDQAEEARDDTFAAVAEVNAAKDFVVNASNGILAAGQSAIGAQAAANASASQAAASAVAAADSANQAEGSNQGAYGNFLNAVDAKTQAEAARNQAASSASLASGYATNASGSAGQAATSAASALSSKNAAQTAATNATASANSAYLSSEAAASSAQSAGFSATVAGQAAVDAQNAVNDAETGLPSKLTNAINWTGDYDNGVTYASGDGVKYAGEYFVLKAFIGGAGYDPAGYPGSWTRLIPSGVGGNPFNQSLNTGDAAQFDSLNVTGDASVGNSLSVSNQITLGAVGSLTQGQLTLSEGGNPMIVSDTKIIFPDATEQTTAAVTTPDASTTVPGKVELATVQEAIAGSSATLAVTPSSLPVTETRPSCFRVGDHSSLNAATSGTGAATQGNTQGVECNSPTTAVGYATRRIFTSNQSPRAVGVAAGVIPWAARKVVFGGLFLFQSPWASNCTGRIYYGRTSGYPNGDTSVANTPQSIEVRWTGSGALTLHCARTTGSVTSVTSTFTPVVDQTFDLRVENVAGVASMFVNGNLVATNTGGPDANSAATGNVYGVVAENVATVAASSALKAGGLYIDAI